MLKFTIRRQDKPGPPEIREFDRAVVTIGRHPDNDLVLPESTISRQHARVERRDGKYHLVDLGSAHGTYMNKERVKDVLVGSSAEIYLNPFVISVQAKDDEVATRTPAGVETTSSGEGANRSTILEVDASPAPPTRAAAPEVKAPPAFEPEATPAEGTFLELEASPGPKRPTAEIEVEDAPPVRQPAPRPVEPASDEPPPEEGTVFELTADAVQAAATPPSTVSPGGPPKARTPTPAPAPTPPAVKRAGSGTGPVGGAPATRMRRKDEGPKAGPRQPTGTTPPAGARSAADLQARLPELMDARDHGKVTGILLGIVTLILAVIPTKGGATLEFLQRTEPALFWSLLGGSMLAAVGGIFIRMPALRGFMLLVAGGLPLGFFVVRPSLPDDFGKLLAIAEPKSTPGLRTLAVEVALNLRGNAALAVVFALGLGLAFVAFRLARLRPGSAFPRVLGLLGGFALIGTLGMPLPKLDGTGADRLVTGLPALLGASPANLLLLVPALVGGLAALLVLAPAARWLTVAGRGLLVLVLCWPACVHLGVNLAQSAGIGATLHQFRMALLPPVLLGLTATGLAAILLDFMLGQDPEEQAFLESL